MNLAGAIMKGATLFTEPTDPITDPKFKWVNDIVDAVNTLLWPLLILVGAAGSIYAVVLGINMAKADSGEKREEAKKRLISAVVGLAIIIALILLMKLLFTQDVLGKFFIGE